MNRGTIPCQKFEWNLVCKKKKFWRGGREFPQCHTGLHPGSTPECWGVRTPGAPSSGSAPAGHVIPRGTRALRTSRDSRSFGNVEKCAFCPQKQTECVNKEHVRWRLKYCEHGMQRGGRSEIELCELSLRGTCPLDVNLIDQFCSCPRGLDARQCIVCVSNRSVAQRTCKELRNLK